MEIRKLGRDDVEAAMGASHLYDEPARREWAERFLTREGHHLFIAYDEDEPVGFVTGVEMTHPDKGTEMLLYELAVDEFQRRAGIGAALVTELRDLAESLGCYGMWVGTDHDNEAAIATYRSTGAADPEPFVLMNWSFTD